MASSAKMAYHLVRNLALLPFILAGNSLASTPIQLDCRSHLQINYADETSPSLVSSEEAAYYGRLNRSTLFPHQELTGTFSIANPTDDTLNLAPMGQSLLLYLHLIFNYQSPSERKWEEIPLEVTEGAIFVYDQQKATYGLGNFLPPHGSVGVYTHCFWDDLARLNPGIVEFQYTFDNSEAAAHDSLIAEVSWHSRVDTFRILANPENCLDSVYYFNFLASKRYNDGHPQAAIDLCRQVLQKDSTNFLAIRLLTDSLWKLYRFEEAESSAKEGIRLLQRERPAEANAVTLEDEHYQLMTMQKRLARIQKHENWQSIDYPGH